MVDEPGLRWAGLSENPTRNASGGSFKGISGSNGRRVGDYRVRVVHRRNFQRLPVASRENRALVTPARRSVLPHWYPRTPPGEITGIMRAIESRRAELQADQPTRPSLENTTNAPSISGAQSKHHEVGASTPLPTILKKPQRSHATQAMKIKDGITPKENRADSDFLSLEKTQLKSTEKVRELWVEEQRKQESTPAAKKAKRQRKVRTLMSMR